MAAPLGEIASLEKRDLLFGAKKLWVTKEAMGESRREKKHKKHKSKKVPARTSAGAAFCISESGLVPLLTASGPSAGRQRKEAQTQEGGQGREEAQIQAFVVLIFRVW